MKRYVVFEGRDLGGDFYHFTVVLVVIAFAALIISGTTFYEAGLDTENKPGGIITALVKLIHFLPSFAVTATRLHDTHRRGLASVFKHRSLGEPILLILMCRRAAPGRNQHGPDPLAPVGSALSLTDPSPAAGGPPMPPQASVATPTRHDTIAELERLGRLREDGHLSEPEFEVLKAEALAQARGA